MKCLHCLNRLSLSDDRMHDGDSTQKKRKIRIPDLYARDGKRVEWMKRMHCLNSLLLSHDRMHDAKGIHRKFFHM